MNKKKILEYIQWAGGPSFVAETLQLSRTTVWHWTRKGFPDTDFSGKTEYAKELARLCRANGVNVSPQQVLQAGRP